MINLGWHHESHAQYFLTLGQIGRNHIPDGQQAIEHWEPWMHRRLVRAHYHMKMKAITSYWCQLCVPRWRPIHMLERCQRSSGSVKSFSRYVRNKQSNKYNCAMRILFENLHDFNAILFRDCCSYALPHQRTGVCVEEARCSPYERGLR